MSAALAPVRADWLPDWREMAVAIIASGPSTKSAGVEQLRGRLPVVAIKQNVELAPWADMVYGCDWPWWRSVQGLPKYGGLRVCFDHRARDQFRLHKVEIDLKNDHLLFETPGRVGAGGNSGFHALNLVAQAGANRILLIGFDCHDRSGVHWYGRNNAPGMNNPGEDNFRRWRSAFEAAAPDLKKRGIDVVNASPISVLKGFRRQSVADTLAEWGLA